MTSSLTAGSKQTSFIKFPPSQISCTEWNPRFRLLAVAGSFIKKGSDGEPSALLHIYRSDGGLMFSVPIQSVGSVEEDGDGDDDEDIDYETYDWEKAAREEEEKARLAKVIPLVTTMAWRPDGELLALGLKTGAIVLVSVQFRTIVRWYQATSQAIRAITWTDLTDSEVTLKPSNHKNLNYNFNSWSLPNSILNTIQLWGSATTQTTVPLTHSLPSRSLATTLHRTVLTAPPKHALSGATTFSSSSSSAQTLKMLLRSPYTPVDPHFVDTMTGTSHPTIFPLPSTSLPQSFLTTPQSLSTVNELSMIFSNPTFDSESSDSDSDSDSESLGSSNDTLGVSYHYQNDLAARCATMITNTKTVVSPQLGLITAVDSTGVVSVSFDGIFHLSRFRITLPSEAQDVPKDDFVPNQRMVNIKEGETITNESLASSLIASIHSRSVNVIRSYPNGWILSLTGTHNPPHPPSHPPLYRTPQLIRSQVYMPKAISLPWGSHPVYSFLVHFTSFQHALQAMSEYFLYVITRLHSSHALLTRRLAIFRPEIRAFYQNRADSGDSAALSKLLSIPFRCSEWNPTSALDHSEGAVDLSSHPPGASMSDSISTPSQATGASLGQPGPSQQEKQPYALANNAMAREPSLDESAGDIFDLGFGEEEDDIVVAPPVPPAPITPQSAAPLATFTAFSTADDDEEHDAFGLFSDDDGDNDGSSSTTISKPKSSSSSSSSSLLQDMSRLTAHGMVGISDIPDSTSTPTPTTLSPGGHEEHSFDTTTTSMPNFPPAGSPENTMEHFRCLKRRITRCAVEMIESHPDNHRNHKNRKNQHHQQYQHDVIQTLDTDKGSKSHSTGTSLPPLPSPPPPLSDWALLQRELLSGLHDGVFITPVMNFFSDSFTDTGVSKVNEGVSILLFEAVEAMTSSVEPCLHQMALNLSVMLDIVDSTTTPEHHHSDIVALSRKRSILSSKLPATQLLSNAQILAVQKLFSLCKASLVQVHRAMDVISSCQLSFKAFGKWLQGLVIWASATANADSVVGGKNHLVLHQYGNQSSHLINAKTVKINGLAPSLTSTDIILVDNFLRFDLDWTTGRFSNHFLQNDSSSGQRTRPGSLPLAPILTRIHPGKTAKGAPLPETAFGFYGSPCESIPVNVEVDGEPPVNRTGTSQSQSQSQSQSYGFGTILREIFTCFETNFVAPPPISPIVSTCASNGSDSGFDPTLAHFCDSLVVGFTFTLNDNGLTSDSTPSPPSFVSLEVPFNLDSNLCALFHAKNVHNSAKNTSSRKSFGFYSALHKLLMAASSHYNYTCSPIPLPRQLTASSSFLSSKELDEINTSLSKYKHKSYPGAFNSSSTTLLISPTSHSSFALIAQGVIEWYESPSSKKSEGMTRQTKPNQTRLCSVLGGIVIHLHFPQHRILDVKFDLQSPTSAPRGLGFDIDKAQSKQPHHSLIVLLEKNDQHSNSKSNQSLIVIPIGDIPCDDFSYFFSPSETIKNINSNEKVMEKGREGSYPFSLSPMHNGFSFAKKQYELSSKSQKFSAEVSLKSDDYKTYDSVSISSNIVATFLSPDLVNPDSSRSKSIDLVRL